MEDKAIAVVVSCNTLAQLYVAWQYIQRVRVYLTQDQWTNVLAHWYVMEFTLENQ